MPLTWPSVLGGTLPRRVASETKTLSEKLGSASCRFGCAERRRERASERREDNEFEGERTSGPPFGGNYIKRFGVHLRTTILTQNAFIFHANFVTNSMTKKQLGRTVARTRLKCVGAFVGGFRRLGSGLLGFGFRARGFGDVVFVFVSFVFLIQGCQLFVIRHDEFQRTGQRPCAGPSPAYRTRRGERAFSRYPESCLPHLLRFSGASLRPAPLLCRWAGVF